MFPTLCFRHPEDLEREIVAALRKQLEVLRRRGVLVAMSGGVDSSVCAGLVVRALGQGRVVGLFLPERDSDTESLALAQAWAGRLGIASVLEDITPMLEACGCYRRRDDAIRRLVPEYGERWLCNISLPAERLDSGQLNVFRLEVCSPSGERRTLRLPSAAYREIVAATSFKQRVRKMMEYHHADRLHYAVVGTPNRLEYDQGFFVKGGDGLADIKPIAHLYKTEVYRLAEHLGVPSEIIGRAPTTDTYSLPQSQEEFYFGLPLGVMDRLLCAYNSNWPAEQTAAHLDLEPDQVRRGYSEIEQKRATTRYLHLPPLQVEPVVEVDSAR